MEKLLEKGEILFSQGKIEEAQECFLEALKESPHSPELLNNIGVTYHAKGDIQHAIEYFLKALEIDSQHLDARINLADAYCGLKEWDKASEHLENCIAYNPNYQDQHELYNRLALVYLESGRVNNAREALRKSLELNPDQPEVKETLDTLGRKYSPKTKSESLGYGCNCQSTGLQYVRINSTTNKDLADRLVEAKIFIAPGSQIRCKEVIIGRCTRINGPITIKGINRCKIGKYCAFGGEIRIITNNHLTNRPNLQDQLQQRLGCSSILTIDTDVDIGSNVWIGDSVIILPGSRIGHGAVIGAGSVVTKPIPPFGIAVGTPAKVIKFRFSPNIIQQLLEISWWDWPEDRILRNKEFFDLDLARLPNIDLFSIITE